tara:strand:- start:621 stop:1169 length:549 start_codon:yes stop_codon:yes gene_type:complete
MSVRGWLYLIRNRDLYKIGITKNFENRMRQLKPDSIVAKLYSSDFIKLERDIHHRYKQFRIPQTEYFRLNEIHINEIKQIISNHEFTLSLTIEICLKSSILVIAIFTIILLIISLFINDINEIFYSSILLMERITYLLSFISLFINSHKNLGFINEIRYRLSKCLTFFLLSFFFQIASTFTL